MVIHIIACFFLAIVVLLQQGKGSDVSAVFGGSSQTLFGSSGAGNLLTKLTSASAIIFMVTSLTLTYGAARQGTKSIFDTAPASAPAPAETPETAPAAQTGASTEGQTATAGQTTAAPTGELAPAAQPGVSAGGQTAATAPTAEPAPAAPAPAPAAPAQIPAKQPAPSTAAKPKAK
jgi:preprotein translocase subunit SecG